MKKKYIFILLTFFLLLLAGLLYILLQERDFQIPFMDRSAKVLEDLNFEKVYATYDITHSEGEEVWLFGKYMGSGVRTGEVNSFDLVHDMYTVNILTEDLERSNSLLEGEGLLLKGYYDEDFAAFVPTALDKINEKTYEEIFVRRYPLVKVEILDEDLSLSHGCENASVNVHIENVGDLPIDYQKTGKKNAEYVFIALIDGQVYSLYPDSSSDDPEGKPVGKLLGFRDFGVLQPGESKQVRFGLGGQVKSGDDGTGGTNHIFCAQRGEEFSIMFGNIRRQDRGNMSDLGYDFVNTHISNKINVEVENCRCILDEVSLPEPL